MKFKKFMAALISVAMIISCVNFTAFAENETATENTLIVSQDKGTLSEALDKAKTMTGDVTVEIHDKVTLNQNLNGSYSSIKFVGMDTDAEIYLDVQGYIEANGKNVSFENLILSKSAGGHITDAGFMNVAFGIYRASSVSYTKCNFANGAYASKGTNTFTNCTFYRSHDKYGLWAYGDVEAVVDNCKFADDRGIKMYAEGAAKTVDLTVKNTDFSAVTDKPAIVLTYGESVTLEKNTYSSTGVFELDLDGAPNGTTVTSDVAPTCKNDNGVCGVLVDGKIYTTVAQAAEVAKEGSTVTLLHNSTETVKFTEGVILDKNGFTAENVTVKSNHVAYIGETGYETVADALDAAKKAEMTDVTITLVGETTKDSTDEFDLYTVTEFDSVTFKQEDASVPYYIDGIYTGKRTNGGTFVFDGVNIVVTGQYIFEGNVKLTNNSVVKSVTESNCFIYYATTTVEPGSKLQGIIDDLRGGKLIVDGGRTDGKFNTTPDVQDSIMIINWSGDSVTLNNGAYVKINAANEVGRLTINAGTSLNVNASKLDSYQWIANTGAINTDVKSRITTQKITGKGTITIDASAFDGNDVQVINANMSEFTGTIKVINKDDATYKVTDTGIVITAVPPVAAIGDKKYPTLAKAVEAAEDGDTITLLDSTTESKITINKNVTIDLADKTVTVPQIMIEAGAKVEIKNGSVVGSSTSSDTIRSEGGNLTLTNVNASGLRHTVRIVSGDATIDGGTYTYGGKTSVSNTLHIINVGDDEAPTTNVANVTINNGTFTAGRTQDGGCAVKVQKGSTVTINGGNFSNGVLSTLEADDGANLYVNGGTYDKNPSKYVAEGYAALADLNGNYVVGTKPTATVNNLGMMTIPAGEWKDMNFAAGTTDMPLSFVMEFIADETAEAGAASPYADWYADFVITVTGLENESFSTKDCYLAGHYGSFGWIKVPLDGVLDTVEEDVRYPVMLGVGMGQKYQYICGGVENFKCAMYLTPEVLEANPDIKVNLELCMIDNSNGENAAAEAITNNNNCFTVEDHTYVKDDFVISAAVAKIGDTEYSSLDKAIEAAQNGDVVEIIADINDVAVEVNKSVTIKGSNNALNNVTFNAVSGCSELTVKDLSFTGNSWINSGAASKLTVSGVTANVTPVNTTYTNSRSGFISLGRSEQHELDLTVESCNIVTGGDRTNPIIGWAAIKKATISGNTFGSASAHQNNSDSAKFMAIADGAVFTITGNTIYSDYNGIVFGQNTTRDNKYTAVIEKNTFIGSADHVWVEVSGASTTHATIRATSDNTVNGNAFTAKDIKHSKAITTWTSYAGVDVTTDANGKVTGGQFIQLNDDAIAVGYEKIDNGDGTFGVVKDHGIFGRPFYIANMTPGNDTTYRVAFFAGIDHLDYSEVGFNFYQDGVFKVSGSTKNVYSSVTAAGKTITAEQLDVFRLFGVPVDFPRILDNVQGLTFQPYAIDLDGNPIEGRMYDIEDIYTLTKVEEAN